MLISDSADTLQRWFYTNAPAAWISALIAIITCIFVLRSRKQPKKIVVREIRNSSLVRIWPSVRDKIEMTFAGQPIRTLGQLDAEIFNEGSDVIQRPTFTLTFPQECRVLGVLLTPEDSETRSRIEHNKIFISMPYLNTRKEHDQVIKVSIVVDGDTRKMTVSGIGEGWSVRHLGQLTPNQRRFRVRLLAFLFLSLNVLTYFYIRWVGRKFGVTPSEVSWRVLLFSVPFSCHLPVFPLLRSDFCTSMRVLIE